MRSVEHPLSRTHLGTLTIPFTARACAGVRIGSAIGREQSVHVHVCAEPSAGLRGHIRLTFRRLKVRRWAG